MSAPARERRPAPPPRTLRRRVGRTFLAILAVLAVLLTAVVVALVDLIGKGGDLINRWQPAYSLSQAVLSDYVNQETGIRGFALSRQESLLDPYTEYVARERQDEDRLAGLLAGRSQLVADLHAVQSAGEQWRSQVAEPFVRRVRAGDPTVARDVASVQALAAFDRVRRADAVLVADVGAVRDTAKKQRTTAAALVWTTIGVTSVLIVVIGIGLWRGLRRAVLAPVDHLAVQARAVASGELDRAIVAEGPPEIAGLGADVDAMRARITAELARVEAARTALQARSDDLARSNADLEQFAYIASHDLSEPLRKVANFCQLLERQYSEQLDDKARQYIHFAVDGAKRMQVLIGDLLEFSRVGRTTEEFVAVDLNAVLDRALANLDARITESGAQIVHGELPTVSGDPSLLTALFQNLIGNAVKYRSDDAPRVELTVTRDDGGWRFTIADNGIGIEPRYAEKIFAIFQRLHLRDQYGGTGIGLALCRKIVEFHGGRIWLADRTDADGRGATFEFTLADHAGVPQAAEPAATAAEAT